MNRIFHHRFTLTAKCGIALFAILAFYLFWQQIALAGALMLTLLIGVVERVLHATYTLTPHELIIYRGRFARRQVIPLSDITDCTPMRGLWGLSHYLLITYGDGRMTGVEPENEREFMKELRKRTHK